MEDLVNQFDRFLKLAHVQGPAPEMVFQLPEGRVATYKRYGMTVHFYVDGGVVEGIVLHPSHTSEYRQFSGADLPERVLEYVDLCATIQILEEIEEEVAA